MHGGDYSVCWEWKGGYGGKADDPRPYFTLDGVKQLAYRIVYKLVNGKDSLTGENGADSLLVRHTCDHGYCCNPKHLVAGTHQDNEWDKILRHRNGGLPPQTVERIRHLAQLRDVLSGKKAYTHKELGEMYGVSRETITGIVSGRRHGPRKELPK